MTVQQYGRRERLLPGGVPRYIRVYDNGGKTCDRYTVVYTGRYQGYAPGSKYFLVAGMSGAPFHPQGFFQHSECSGIPDRPKYAHLGKKIKFQDLPADCQKAVLQDYTHLWDIPN